jgi:hypothetical protein
VINPALAPEPVMRAALDVLGHACVFVRNSTLSTDVSVKMINDLMEAIHGIPSQLKTWNNERIEALRIHLRCFDSTLYPGAPNLLNRFEILLASYNEEAEQCVPPKA